jgi:hypothetical protein
MARFSLAGSSDRSPQFELKLLTNISILYTRERFPVYPLPYGRGSGNAYAFRIQPDCQTSAHPIRDFAKANYMPASKAVRPQQKRPEPEISP